MLTVSQALVWGLCMQVNSFNSHNNSIWYVLSWSPSHWGDNRGSQRRNNLPVTQRVSVRARMPTQCNNYYLSSSDLSLVAHTWVHFALQSRWIRKGRSQGSKSWHTMELTKSLVSKELSQDIFTPLHQMILTIDYSVRCRLPFSSRRELLLLLLLIHSSTSQTSLLWSSSHPTWPSHVRVSLRFGHWTNN